MPEQWRRALLRAALREVGYDAIGARGIAEAQLIRAVVPDRGTVRVIIVDQAALGTGGLSRFAALRARHENPRTILLARATVDAPKGPWDRVLRRPVSIEQIVAAVRSLVPLPQSARAPID